MLEDSLSNQPKVSVIISAKNEEERIGLTLKAVQNLDYSNYEVIFVDGGSTDNTVEKAKEMENVKIFWQEDSTPGEGRNTGIRNSQSPFVAVLDGDCIPRTDWLKNALSLMKKENVGGVGGPRVSSCYGNLMSRIYLDVLSTRFASFGSPVFARPKNSKEVTNLGGVGVYAREALEKSGLYSEDLRFCEDVDLDFRIRASGYRLIYSPNVVVEHNWKVDSSKKLFKHMFLYGNGRAKAGKMCHSLFSIFHTIPSCMFLFGAMLLLSSIIFGGIFSYALIFFIAIYLSLTLLASIAATLEFRDKIILVFAPLCYFATHFGYAIGFLVGLVTKVKVI